MIKTDPITFIRNYSISFIQLCNHANMNHNMLIYINNMSIWIIFFDLYYYNATY